MSSEAQFSRRPSDRMLQYCSLAINVEIVARLLQESDGSCGVHYWMIIWELSMCVEHIAA